MDGFIKRVKNEIRVHFSDRSETLIKDQQLWH